MRILAASLLVILSACSGPDVKVSIPIFDEKDAVAKYSTLKGIIVKAPDYKPKIDRTDQWVADDERIIAEGMRMKMTVPGYDELCKTYVIPADGKIYVKYIKEITVVNMTLRNVREGLQQRLAQYLLSPNVVIEVPGVVNPFKAINGKITIAGAVENPGEYELEADNPYLQRKTKMPLAMLLAAKAKYKQDSALITQIIVVRSLPNEGFKVIVCDFTRFYQIAEEKQNLPLIDGDLVIVPKIYNEKHDVAPEFCLVANYIEGKLSKEELLHTLSK